MFVISLGATGVFGIRNHVQIQHRNYCKKVLVAISIRGSLMSLVFKGALWHKTFAQNLKIGTLALISESCIFGARQCKAATSWNINSWYRTPV